MKARVTGLGRSSGLMPAVPKFWVGGEDGFGRRL
jgi:hypothetical protein